MKYIELQYAFELEAANLDQPLADKINSEDILYWLNQGVIKFIKTRYNGNNPNKTSFEQDEKRTRDLINLLKKADLTNDSSNVTSKYTVSHYTYPSDLMFVIDEMVILGIGGQSVPTEIFECTHDSYMYRITNSLTDFHLRNGYARPLRVMDDTGCNLYTDNNYTIDSYSVAYLRNPSKITLSNPHDQYTEFPEYAQSEIVKLAVQMYLENASNPRYQSINNEVALME